MKKTKKENLWQKLGPGFITGASDDDPSGIATYTQVGAQFGFGQIWSVIFLWPLMSAIQEMVGRIGMVAGRGLVGVIKNTYSKWVVYVFIILILIANTVNIGADLGAMAASTNLIVPQIPFPVLAIGYTVLILFLEIFLSYKVYAKILKWLALSLFSYLLTLIIVTSNWGEILARVLVPTIILSKEFVIALTAVFGTTISPYLFVWQSNEEVEEEISLGRNTLKKRLGATAKEIKTMRRDTLVGMAFSQIITFCIIGTAANTFFKNGIFDIQSTAQAAQALEPLVGRFASLVFSIGVVGTGLLAVPVLSASAAYALAEAFDWSEGLNKKFRQAHGFYGIITISTLIGLLINFVGLNPIKALFWSAVLNGLVTPPLLAIILKTANNPKVMGKLTNKNLANILGYVTLICTTACAILIFVLN
ncbi:MAG: Nramp family divalent metal transporter [Patescibacteria group bacterium]|jgi:Mn2+/Fe2+ NRAMP family transporter